MVCIDLNLERYHRSLVVRQLDDRRLIMDPVRKQWIVLTPEEMVRQLFISYILDAKISGLGRISVEKEVLVNGRKHRYDLAIHDRHGAPWLLLECKEPGIAIDAKVVDQAANYNIAMQVPFLAVTNGSNTLVYSIDHAKGTYSALSAMPRLQE